MNQRIRYIKGVNHSQEMVGNKYYQSNSGKEYHISFIDFGSEVGCRGYVREGSHETPFIIELASTSPHKIKIALKAKLEELGCEFEKETRSKE